MSSFSSSAASTISPSGSTAPHAELREDVTYQVVTVAAMLLVLASLWVF